MSNSHCIQSLAKILSSGKRFSLLETVCNATTLLFSLFMLLSMIANAEITVQISPVRQVYHYGDPIDLQLIVGNRGQHAIELLFSYPDNIGVAFSSKEPGVTASIQPLIGGRSPLVKIAAGGTYKRRIALNRHLQFSKNKKYGIAYVAEYMVRSEDQPSFLSSGASSGTFDVEFTVGKTSQEMIQHYAKQAGEEGLVASEDAVEMLVWAEDPAIIPPLTQAARRFPTRGTEIVSAITKYFKEDGTQAALAEIGLAGNSDTLSTIIEVFNKQGITAPKKFLKQLLNSTDTRKLYVVLDYLVKTHNFEFQDAVRPLANHQNSEVRRLAAELLSSQR